MNQNTFIQRLSLSHPHKTMNKLFCNLVSAIFVIVILVNLAYAQDSSQIEKIRLAAEKALAGQSQVHKVRWINEIKLYEVQTREGIFLYMTPDTKHFIAGSLFQNTSPPTNLSEQTKNDIRVAIVEDIATLPNSEFIIYKASGNERGEIFVFTDAYCPFCKRFHEESLNELLDEGITVKYLLFPVIRRSSRELANAIWCSDDKADAYHRAVLGDFNDILNDNDGRCDTSIIETHMSFARQIGVRGTPFIVLPNGKTFPGVVSADQIISELNP